MSEQEPSPLAFLAAALFSVCMGGVIFLAALGAIPSDPQSFQAPRWVVAAGGLLFMLAGMAVAFQGLRQTSFGRTPVWELCNALLAMGLVLLLAIPFHWVAFGPGERRFTGGWGLPFLRVSAPPSELPGRALFGTAAVFLDVVFLWGTFSAVRRFLRRR